MCVRVRIRAASSVPRPFIALRHASACMDMSIGAAWPGM